MTPVRLLSAILCAGLLAAFASFVPEVPRGVGYFGAAVGFGLAPGLVVALRLLPNERFWLTLARAMFLSPLLSGAASTALLLGGASPNTASAILLGVAYSAALAALAVAPRTVWNTPLPLWERRLVIWLGLLFLMAIVPHALREWVRTRSDAVFHTAVVLEMGARGVPPQDPYFAGMSLNYLWFYHALLTVWGARAGGLAWDLGGLINALWLVSLGGGAFAVSRRLGRPAREAFFASLFVVLGLSCAFWLWMPLKLARALVGETAGWEAVKQTFSLSPFTYLRMWDTISLFHSPAALLNKYLVMSAFGGGVTALIWLAEGVVGIVRSSQQLGSPTERAWAAHRGHLGEVAIWTPSRRWQGWLFWASFGSWVWHPALGIAVALGCALTGARFLIVPGGVGRRAVARVALAYLGGTLLAVPVLLTSVGQADTAFPLGWSPAPMAILLGGLGALLLGAPALWRLRGTAPGELFQTLAVSWMVAAFFVVLPYPNTEDKMPFVFFLLPAVAAGWTVARWLRGLARRNRAALGVLAVGALLVPVTALTFAVYLLEPAPRAASTGEQALYAWIRDESPDNAVFLDTAERDDILVYGARRQLFGRETYARLWGYPAQEMERRRTARDLFTPEGAAEPSSGIVALEHYAQEFPVFLVWRPGDHDGASAASSMMARFPSRFVQVWHNDEATVFEYRPS